MAKNKNMSPAMELAFSEAFGDIDPIMDSYYDDQYKISTAIFIYREKNGLTQTELANYLGITQAMVSKYESGDYNFTLRTLHELFHKLGYVYQSTINVLQEDTYQLSAESSGGQDYSDPMSEELPIAS